MGTQANSPDGRGGLVPIGPNTFSYFQHLTPVARAGYSIDIYYVPE